MTELQRCGTCVHWEQQDWAEGFSDAPIGEARNLRYDDPDREAAQVAANAKFGVCRGVPAVPPADLPTPLAFTMDGSEYVASLNTQAEFGCVLHQPKDDEQPPAPEAIPVELLLPDPELMGSPEGDAKGLAELKAEAYAQIKHEDIEYPSWWQEIR